MDLQWFYEDRRNFVSFATMLEDRPNGVYTCQFVENLLEGNWKT